MYEVITSEFRSVLHARWSVFFDELDVPYLYEPMSFHASDGEEHVPAFWLPEQRIWFDAEETTADGRVPAVWARFAAAVHGRELTVDTPWEEDSDEDAGQVGWAVELAGQQPIVVGEEWQGRALLRLGGLPFGSLEAAWRGMNTGGEDSGYQWTLCPQCGCFGAEYIGYAERLPCQCLESRGERKVDNSTDARLATAYRAAAMEPLGDTGEREAKEGRPVARQGLVKVAGAARAQELCTGWCRSVAEQMRAEFPAGAEIPADAEALCGECAGFVCTACGQGPAAAADGRCRQCDPVVMLSYNRTRVSLNNKAAQAGKQGKRSAYAINTLLNRATGAARRATATWPQLADAMTLVDRWIDNPALIPPDGPDRRRQALRELTEAHLAQLDAQALRDVIADAVGPLAAATGQSIPAVQMTLNYAMGVDQRKQADEEQLRDGVRRVQEWMATPGAYHVYLGDAESAATSPPSTLRRSRTAPADSACGLCAGPIAAGEQVGVPHAPPQRGFAAPSWLCAHCLHERRSKPRRVDVLLRIFHLTFRGWAVRLNQTEAECLLRWLLEVTLPDSSARLREAFDDLEAIIDAPASVPEMPVRYHGVHACMATLALTPADSLSTHEETVLRAAEHHISEWRTNPAGLDPDCFGSRTQWRRAILQQTDVPSVLSERGGPFFV
ncbi:hypothetical protein [Streptomyces sp. 891-h]|uniref:hypothetical protein n=1 Tax=Streptomyces sp. 891-h TaxID=2720714 RepID=UPI001FAA490C|nr:hypothetical protein [Streptomyces sp. 891-h]UNZ21373.1 hypothetical protein HC362_34305 [Streptomyces sp. 891-h]